MRPLVACGRHSLPVFAAGCLLAYASWTLFQVFGTGWLMQVGVNLVGIGTTLALASLLEVHRVRRAGRPAHAPVPVRPLAAVRRALLAVLFVTAFGANADAQDAAFPALRNEETVGRWTRLGDELGDGLANWHTLAIMQMAMHDALNAARPVFQRWASKELDEPAATGSPEAAMAAAARQVLLSLHPDRTPLIERVFATAMAEIQPGPARDDGVKLGTAIGAGWLRRRASDGFKPAYLFPTSNEPGVWRPTPPTGRDSGTTSARPFLSGGRIEPGARDPPALGSAQYLAEVEETRQAGGTVAPLRAREGNAAAVFWAYQSSQRGYMDLGLRLLAEHRQPNGVWDDARIMSQLASALADSAVIIWAEKEHFLRWRPITAIQQGGFGVAADPAWTPLVETPHFPEYPSGHTSDCFTGAGVLTVVFGPSPITYYALGGQTARMEPANGMGQHAQGDQGPVVPRPFSSLMDSAEECAQSRIWAGAHFRSANDEARRVAEAIVRRAAAAVPPLR